MKRCTDIANRLDQGKMRPNDNAAMAEIFPRLVRAVSRKTDDPERLRMPTSHPEDDRPV